MNYRNYITIEPNKRSGKPCVRGLRITVYEVLEYLASDMTEAEILEDFPDLTREDLKACIAYAADRERRFIYPLQEDPRFTDGMNCSRNTHSYKQSYIRSAIM
jgi:uncharacterized protein (DUF433 family)